MDNLAAHIVFTSLMVGIGLRNAKNDFERIRWHQTAALYFPIAKKCLSDLRMERHGLDPYRPKFEGYHPLTGLPVTVIFDEPAPGRSSILQWSPLLQSWTYSENAGVRWRRVDFNDFIENVDCLTSEPKFDKN